MEHSPNNENDFPVRWANFVARTPVLCEKFLLSSCVFLFAMCGIFFQNPATGEYLKSIHSQIMGKHVYINFLLALEPGSYLAQTFPKLFFRLLKLETAILAMLFQTIRVKTRVLRFNNSIHMVPHAFVAVVHTVA